MKLKNKWFICTSAIGRALRIALQDPALYLDLCREAGFCLYRLNTASSLRHLVDWTCSGCTLRKYTYSEVADQDTNQNTQRSTALYTVSSPKMKSKQKRVSSLWTHAFEDVKKRHTNSSPFECYEANTYTYRRALFASFSRAKQSKARFFMG